MSGRLDGTTVIVTGASSGIGEATARALAAEGATVALLARRRERLEALATELPKASVHPVDVTDDDALHAAVAAVVEQHGGLDVLVNNAGFGSWGPAAESDVADWRTMIDVNLTGVLSTTHAALPHLATAAGGPRGGSRRRRATSTRPPSTGSARSARRCARSTPSATYGSVSWSPAWSPRR